MGDGSRGAVVSLLAPGTAAALERRLTPEPERAPINDPVKWCREKLDEHPWSVQREVLRAVIEHRRVAVPSCHGSGKSYMASRLASWWIDEHPVGEGFVVTSAPLGHQVKSIMWREIAKAHRKGGLAGTLSGLRGNGPVEWHIGNELVGFGRKPQDLADQDQARQQFQGIHAPYVLVVLDEATGIPPWLWEASLSLLTNPNARILAIGNPDDPSSHFAEVCQPGSGWHVRPISAFDTPAFTGEPVSEVVKEGLVSREWVEEAERDYGGKDNPLYQSKVLGLFPDTSDNLVISPRLVRQAWARELPGVARGAYGLDVSRSPRGDETALYRVRGGVARYVDSWKGLPITARLGEDSTVARTESHWKRTPDVPVVVDNDGMGVGATDGLRAVGVPVVAFSASGPARRPERYDSRRSELWWEFRKALERGEIDLDEDDQTLAAQLQQPRWWLDARGRIHVETKAEMAARGKSSPDRSDSVLMAHLGEPIDLREHGPMGERRSPAPSTPRIPDALRVRPGEGERIRKARW